MHTHTHTHAHARTRTTATSPGEPVAMTAHVRIMLAGRHASRWGVYVCTTLGIYVHHAGAYTCAPRWGIYVCGALCSRRGTISACAAIINVMRLNFFMLDLRRVLVWGLQRAPTGNVLGSDRKYISNPDIAPFEKGERCYYLRLTGSSGLEPGKAIINKRGSNFFGKHSEGYYVYVSNPYNT